ncbi:MAG: hypothetical protein CMF22_04665 [Idiomarinaceae bacterium]|nr:hypothetical protein [Idiomarinaceae bacterium]|tara:strand:+ start:1992 stop:3263 length:1272 start_codon:yes stop_codon:yes gene_type:complete
MKNFILATTLSSVWKKIDRRNESNSKFLSQIQKETVDALIDETVEIIIAEMALRCDLPPTASQKPRGCRSDATKLLVYAIRLNESLENRISRHASMKEYLQSSLSSIIDSDTQLITLVSANKAKLLKPTSRFNVVSQSHTYVQNRTVHETFTVDQVLTDGKAFEEWEGAPYFPKVNKNAWYSDPNGLASRNFHLSRNQLATLLLGSRVQLNELVLNDNDHQFDMSVSVQLAQPVTIYWANLSLDTQINMLALAETLLAKLYKEFITIRVDWVKRDLVPQLQEKGVALDSSNITIHIKHLNHLFDPSLSTEERFLVTVLYHTMLAPRDAQDGFLVDVATQTVKLSRLPTNVEVLKIAKLSIKQGRNRRLKGYSDKQFYTDGEKDLANGSQRWVYESEPGDLSKHYREVHIKRLLDTYFARCIKS